MDENQYFNFIRSCLKICCMSSVQCRLKIYWLLINTHTSINKVAIIEKILFILEISSVTCE